MPLSVLVFSDEEFNHLKKRERRIALDIERDSLVNEDNKRANIREEIDRASEAIRAAHLLVEDGFVRDAVSKIYYSLLYSIRVIFKYKLHKGV